MTWPATRPSLEKPSTLKPPTNNTQCTPVRDYRQRRRFPEDLGSHLVFGGIWIRAIGVTTSMTTLSLPPTPKPMRQNRAEKKATPFGKEVTALGLVLDLTKFHLGEVRICHTDQRIEELEHTLNDILTRDCLEPAAAESLRGRPHWFTSFLFGRRTCQALRIIGKRATSPNCPKSLDPEIAQIAHGGALDQL